MIADYIIFFIFGTAFGSFFNVIISRYDGERWLADPRVINGRSHCPHCHKTLRWFELLPLVSFVIQAGRCRHCHTRISWQYPIVELLTGAIFVGVPWKLLLLTGPWFCGLWMLAFCILLMMAVIDLRLGIVPDELSVLLFFVALALAGIGANLGALAPSSSLGMYGNLFGLQHAFEWNRILGVVVGLVIFGGLWLVTRGKGMGFGDVKLAIPLGLLFGWPDTLLVAMTAFIIGAIVGVIMIAKKEKTMQSAVPFGPFLALAAALVFFAGAPLAAWYFGLMGL